MLTTWYTWGSWVEKSGKIKCQYNKHENKESNCIECVTKLVVVVQSENVDQPSFFGADEGAVRSSPNIIDPVVLVRRIRTCTRDRRPTGKRNGQLRKRCVSWRYLQGWEQEASVTHRNLGLRFHENPEQQITKIRRRKKSGWQILVEWQMIITLKLPQI